ncbi:sensor histidine kinase [uncultured Gelidibacter sp.]|uniref:sensor histidine kinase n=1 Tax=uncultured Gelidibacter sp. TaxID=259318 RepID=UPI002634A929|nr:sensor histidine kinase [uncultured Gelidibacter sp.]
MVQTGEQLISTDAQRYLLLYMIAVLVIVTTLIIVFFIVFQKRKNKLLIDKIKQQKQFEETVSKTKEEIQEQTLKYIGQELHDNIGQLLSLASMQMGMLGVKIGADIKEPYVETQSIIKESLGEVRALSKSLNTEVIQNRGFVESIKFEIARLNKLKLMTADFVITGDVIPFKNTKDSTILFRILQEFISNSVRHSRASKLTIALDFSPNELLIEASDDGVGFAIDEVKDSSGLLNMKNRAELVESVFKLTSQPNQGTKLSIAYPISKRVLKDSEFL